MVRRKCRRFTSQPVVTQASRCCPLWRSIKKVGEANRSQHTRQPWPRNTRPNRSPDPPETKGGSLARFHWKEQGCWCQPRPVTISTPNSQVTDLYLELKPRVQLHQPFSTPNLEHSSITRSNFSRGLISTYYPISSSRSTSLQSSPRPTWRLVR